MDYIEFSEIWLSDTNHLTRFNEIAHKLNWWKQIFRKQRIDNSFPHIDVNGHKMPIVFFSSGKIKIENNKLIFNAKKPQDILTSKYMNLENELQFKIGFNEIKEISKYKIPNARYENHNYPWVRILLQEGNEYLFLCKMKRGEVEKGLKITEELYVEIKKHCQTSYHIK